MHILVVMVEGIFIEPGLIFMEFLLLLFLLDNVGLANAIFFISALNNYLYFSFYLAGFFTAKTLKMRMVGGAWCLAALVLVTAYSSVLVSFYSAPIYQPLIGSMEELSNRDDVNLVVLKYFAADRTLSVHLIATHQ